MSEENEKTPLTPPDFEHEPQFDSGSGDPRPDPEGSALLKGKAWLEKRRANAQVDLMGFAEWISRAVQKKGTSFFGKLLTLLICAYFFSDLAALFAGKLIPEPPFIQGGSVSSYRRNRTLEDYGVIFTRNLFNSKGLIPGDDVISPGAPIDQGGAPTRTTLPFSLVGTLILRDEIRSIATIEDKASSLVYPVRVDDEIPTKAKILKIEPTKVIFLNISSGRREFVDLPEDVIAINPRITLGSARAASGGPGIEQTSATTFNIARTEVDKALSNLNNILTEARAVPNFENGIPAGYKLFQIVPGSIYDKLGFKNGDVISGLDGQPITDPAKAFEMLSKLKETPHLEIAGKRDGRPFNFSYDIR